MSLRLVFMGSPDFAVPALNALFEAGHEIAAVYAQPPRPAGRGKKLRPTPVHERAEQLGIEVRIPVSLKDAAAQADFAALEADAAIVAAYGLILPQPVLDAPRLGCINIHPSDLPRWRGAAPIQRSIMAGDQETAVCIMQMEAGLDTGPVIERAAFPIGKKETAADLNDRLAAQGAALLLTALERVAEETATLTPQSEEGVTYAAKIDKAEAKIDWSRPADALDAHIRGLSPFPGAWCEAEGERVKILLAAPEQGGGPAGTALDDRGLIACGKGALRLLRLQRAGKPPMQSEDFLRGFPLPQGSVLG